ncbi:hypothetical protein Tco_0068303 [Tanacetum coccineum]
MAKKLSKFSKLVTVDPPGDTTVPTLPPRRFLMPVSFGLPFIRMLSDLSNLVMHVKGKAKSLNERISHKRTKNQSKRDKTGHGMEKCVETKPNQRADYANWETSFIKERKGEIKNEKKSDVEGPFLYTNQTSS